MKALREQRIEEIRIQNKGEQSLRCDIKTNAKFLQGLATSLGLKELAERYEKILEPNRQKQIKHLLQKGEKGGRLI